MNYYTVKFIEKSILSEKRAMHEKLSQVLIFAFNVNYVFQLKIVSNLPRFFQQLELLVVSLFIFTGLQTY